MYATSRPSLRCPERQLDPNREGARLPHRLVRLVGLDRATRRAVLSSRSHSSLERVARYPNCTPAHQAPGCKHRGKGLELSSFYYSVRVASHILRKPLSLHPPAPPQAVPLATSTV